MIINNIKIGDIIIRDIEKLIKENIFFTTYDIFKILDNYLYQKQNVTTFKHFTSDIL